MYFLRGKNKGFGLIELLVAISIMTLVSVAILTRHRAFDSAVVLRNQAYEVAFTIREAQNLAVSAAYSPDSTVAGTQYHQRYGVRFDLGEPQVYRLFRDNNGNGSYDNGEEYGAPGILDPRFSITALTNSADNPISGGVLEVMFERPNFDAIFSTSDELVKIVVSTESGEERKIQVTRTGQISVLDIP